VAPYSQYSEEKPQGFLDFSCLELVVSFPREKKGKEEDNSNLGDELWWSEQGIQTASPSLTIK